MRLRGRICVHFMLLYIKFGQIFLLHHCSSIRWSKFGRSIPFPKTFGRHRPKFSKIFKRPPERDTVEVGVQILKHSRLSAAVQLLGCYLFDFWRFSMVVQIMVDHMTVTMALNVERWPNGHVCVEVAVYVSRTVIMGVMLHDVTSLRRLSTTLKNVDLIQITRRTSFTCRHVV